MTAEVWRFVLSAGRTGTVFLEQALERAVPGIHAVHEPFPSRYEMMLANLRNDTGIGANLLEAVVRTTIAHRQTHVAGPYVEINPFLCALADVLPRLGHPLRVVHIVRDPVSWAQSMTAFKASDRFRWAINWFPFARPYPAPRPVGWSQLTLAEKALWQWRWCNEKILAIKPECAKYALVRYEDLFATEADVRATALATVFDVLGLPAPASEEAIDVSERVNAAPGRAHEIDMGSVQRICGDLAADFGYAA